MLSYKGVGRLGELLGGLATARSWRSRLAQHAVFLFWPEVVGEEIAAVSRPEVIRDAVLWVRVADPVWTQQLQFEKNVMLTAINRRLQPEEQLAAIRFRLDPGLEREQEQLAGERLEAQEAAARTAGSRRDVSPDPATEAEFVRMIGGINDAEARANLLRLWRKAQRAGG